MIVVPIHPRYRKVLEKISEKYCNTRDMSQDGVKTCKKALQVFYATMKTKNIDYTKEPIEETLKMVEHETVDTDINEVIEWYLKNEFKHNI